MLQKRPSRRNREERKTKKKDGGRERLVDTDLGNKNNLTKLKP